MKLKSVQIENYRAIEELRLRLDPQLTVLHGDNTHGKTSVLNAIAVCLGAVPSVLPDVPGIILLKKDQRDGRDLSVSVTTNEEISWERRSGWFRRDNDGKIISPDPLRDLKNWLESNVVQVCDSPADLPILAFYDTERSVPKLTRQRSLSRIIQSRYAALAGALSEKTSFLELFEWFYLKENEELRERGERRDQDYRLKELSVVRGAISSMIEVVTEPHVEFRPLRFVVSERRNGESTARRTIDMLSGGCQSVLALAADMAWRMAHGNPHLSNPLESEAICLIDEVELHLHPSWQKRILGDLMRTFPNTQFIVSTNSPQILTTVQPHHIVELYRENDRIYARQTADAISGAKAGEALSTVMDVNERRSADSFAQILDRYTRLVSGGHEESEEARALRRELENAVSTRSDARPNQI